MKGASEEANLTVVAIILIAVIVAVATPIITSMMSSTQERACCMEAGGTWENGSCSTSYDSDCASGSTSTS